MVDGADFCNESARPGSQAKRLCSSEAWARHGVLFSGFSIRYDCKVGGGPRFVNHYYGIADEPNCTITELPAIRVAKRIGAERLSTNA